jgi:uncharacterized protein YodC (DUF2158 family)
VDINIGDVVRLYSGGPKMTVFLNPSPQSTGEILVNAMWMDDRGNLHRDCFNSKVLVNA